MAARTVLKTEASKRLVLLGNALLRSKSHLVRDVGASETQDCIRDLMTTLKANRGRALGLAAVQLGVPLRIFITNIHDDSSLWRPTVFVNPSYTVVPQTPTTAFWESCLSIPWLTGLVDRPGVIDVTYLNEEGILKKERKEEFDAVVFQHEFDHLSGILMTDKLRSPQHICYQEELIRLCDTLKGDEKKMRGDAMDKLLGIVGGEERATRRIVP